MPIQQSIDVAVPIKRAYNYWTSFEDWPEFMHRIESAEEVDNTTVSFQAKIWGISKRFEAEIVEQQPRSASSGTSPTATRTRAWSPSTHWRRT